MLETLSGALVILASLGALGERNGTTGVYRVLAAESIHSFKYLRQSIDHSHRKLCLVGVV